MRIFVLSPVILLMTVTAYTSIAQGTRVVKKERTEGTFEEDSLGKTMEKSEGAIEKEQNVREVFDEPEMPVYPGGEKALFGDIDKNILYPELEKKMNISGIVQVSFIVEKDGTISNVEAVKGIPGADGLSLEAERVVKLLKPFQPAKLNGVPRRMHMSLPVKFKL